MFEVSVDGEKLPFSSLETMFSFDAFVQKARVVVPEPLAHVAGKPVAIWRTGELIFKGFCDAISLVLDDKGAESILYLSDAFCDCVESESDRAFEFAKGTSLSHAVSSLLGKYQFSNLIDASITLETSFRVEIGDRLFDALSKAFAASAVFPLSDGRGGLGSFKESSQGVKPLEKYVNIGFKATLKKFFTEANFLLINGEKVRKRFIIGNRKRIRCAAVGALSGEEAVHRIEWEARLLEINREIVEVETHVLGHFKVGDLVSLRVPGRSSEQTFVVVEASECLDYQGFKANLRLAPPGLMRAKPQDQVPATDWRALFGDAPISKSKGVFE